MTKFSLIALLTLLSLATYGQSFEGYITYKTEVLNPNPEMIPDSAWQEGIKAQLGELGYMIQKYYYKEANYISEIQTGNEKGFQAYNPEDGLLYSWQENSDTAITVDSRQYSDQLEEIIDSEETETILGIVCQKVILRSSMVETTLWYNPNHLKMDAKFFEGHQYGHWDAILNKIGCLPLKIEQKGFMSHVVQTATDFKETSISDKQFKMPKFKEVIASPVN